MRKLKYLLYAIILFFSLLSFYRNYIFYQIPYNPLVGLTHDTPMSCYFTEYHPDDEVTGSSHSLENNTLIFKYFRDLNLIPLKKEANIDEIFKHTNDIHLSYTLKFDSSPNYVYIYISEIYLDDLTIVSIRSNIPKFRNGYYKIIDSKFDYEYINDLITNS